MKRYLIRYICAVLSGLIIFGGIAASGDEIFAATENAPDFTPLKGAVSSTLENEDYALYFDGVSGDVAVQSKKSGYIWRSNAESNEKNKEQLVIYYYDDGKLRSMDSYNDGTSFEDRIESSVTGDTLTVSYYIAAESFSVDILPRVLTAKRMEEDILPKLSEDEKDVILKRYKYYNREELDEKSLETIKLSFPGIKKSNLYILSNVPGYIGQEIYDLLLKTGYTLSDLERDCKENGIENTYREKPYFRVSICYTLTNDGLKVTLPTDKISYSENYKPFRINLLPYFGATNKSSEGYMLVPDGSGAIINYNNKKSSVDSYEKSFFAHDTSLSKDESEAANTPSILPIFASVGKNGGFLATVDSGYEVGGIRAEVTSGEGTFNRIHAYFDLFPSDTVSLSVGSLGSFILNSQKIFSAPITISYHFTNGGVSYSDLAVLYREKLIADGILKDKNTDSIELNISLITTATVTERFLGIPYDTLAAISDYESALSILSDFGDYKTELNLVNALEGGNQQKHLDKLKLSGRLGSEKEWNALCDKADKLSVSYYAAHSAKLKKSNSAMTLSKKPSKLYRYDTVSRYITAKGSLFTLSPRVYETFADKIVSSIKKHGIKRVNINDIGYMLSSDFNTKSLLDRYEARLMTESYLEKLSGSAEIGINVGSIYSLKYADKLIGIPTDSSRYLIEDETVPFYQIAISGYIPFTAEAINTAADKRSEFLRTVELGGQLHYRLVSDLLETIADRNEQYYDSLYYAVKYDVANNLSEYSELYSKIYSASVKRHSCLAENLYKTEWDNGVVVYVNYGKSDVSADGITVPSMNFEYREGEIINE